MRRLTESVIKEVLQTHEGYHKKVPLYGCDITWHYVIKDGILKIYEVGNPNSALLKNGSEEIYPSYRHTGISTTCWKYR